MKIVFLWSLDLVLRKEKKKMERQKEKLIVLIHLEINFNGTLCKQY